MICMVGAITTDFTLHPPSYAVACGKPRERPNLDSLKITNVTVVYKNDFENIFDWDSSESRCLSSLRHYLLVALFFLI